MAESRFTTGDMLMKLDERYEENKIISKLEQCRLLGTTPFLKP
jgi:hypothetical protein